MQRERRNLVWLLLVTHASMMLVSALGLLVYALYSRAVGLLIGPEGLAIGGVAVLLVLAYGTLRDWRWARGGAIAYEALTLLGTCIALLASRGQALTLTMALTGIVLPVLIITAPRIRADSLASGLLLTTGVIHLAIAPDHLSENALLGQLFVLDGIAAIGLALLSYRTSSWRAPAAFLLAASIAAYWIVLLKRVEGVEDLAIATKVLEIAALGLILALNQRWLRAASGVVASTVLTGTVAWAAEFSGGATGHDTHNAHDGRVVQAAAAPTAEQRAAAQQLVENTQAGIARYEDVNVAFADGYRPSTPQNAPTVHYMNGKFARDGQVLDTQHPPALVYANTPNGPLLLGAMYLMPKANELGPAVGGSLTEWHVHPNLCFLPGAVIDGAETPFGTCPAGSVNAPTPAMLHVWTVPNPTGPFGDLEPAYVKRLTGGRA